LSTKKEETRDKTERGTRKRKVEVWALEDKKGNNATVGGAQNRAFLKEVSWKKKGGGGRRLEGQTTET